MRGHTEIDINLLSIIKPTQTVEKCLYLFISLVFGWIPAFIVAAYFS